VAAAQTYRVSACSERRGADAAFIARMRFEAFLLFFYSFSALIWLMCVISFMAMRREKQKGRP
jgi:hypothetical protein